MKAKKVIKTLFVGANLDDFVSIFINIFIKKSSQKVKKTFQRPSLFSLEWQAWSSRKRWQQLCKSFFNTYFYSPTTKLIKNCRTQGFEKTILSIISPSGSQGWGWWNFLILLFGIIKWLIVKLFYSKGLIMLRELNSVTQNDRPHKWS